MLLVIGENYFSAEAAAVLEELTQGKLLQAQVVGRAEDGIPYVHIYQISGNTSVSMVFKYSELIYLAKLVVSEFKVIHVSDIFFCKLSVSDESMSTKYWFNS